MWKKSIAVVLALVLVWGFAACSKSSKTDSTKTGKSTTQTDESKKNLQGVSLDYFYGVWKAKYDGKDIYYKLERKGDIINFTSAYKEDFEDGETTPFTYSLKGKTLHLLHEEEPTVTVTITKEDDTHVSFHIEEVDYTEQFEKIAD